MTDVKDQEHLRDTISSVLEISRASWKLRNNQEAYEEEINEGDFPRSMLLRTLLDIHWLQQQLPQRSGT